MAYRMDSESNLSVRSQPCGCGRRSLGSWSVRVGGTSTSGADTSSHLAATGLLSSEQPVIVTASAAVSTADTIPVALRKVIPSKKSPAQPTGDGKKNRSKKY